MAPKVQGTRNDSIHQIPPSFLSAKTLQHCKHTGLNQAYFTRSLIINTFFASLPGVNFIRKKARVCGSIASLLYAVCLYRAYGRWTLSLHIYIMNSWWNVHPSKNQLYGIQVYIYTAYCMTECVLIVLIIRSNIFQSDSNRSYCSIGQCRIIHCCCA